MKTKTDNNNQNTPKTPKTEPSAEDKALAELIRTKILDFIHDMEKLCKDNGLSFYISGWAEDPVDRGDAPNKTLSFNCAKGNVLSMVVHQIIDVSSILNDCVNKFSPDEVIRLCTMSKHLISYACKKVMTKLNNNMETKEK